MPVPTGTRVVVVTGASAGVGRAVVDAFAARGNAVGLIARGEMGLQGAAADAMERGAAAVLPVAADVSNADEVEEAAQRIEEELGPIGVWVNCAGVGMFARSWDVRPEEYRRVLEVNYLGTVHGTLAALERMRPRGSGTVVQVSSVQAFHGVPQQAASSAAAHAVKGFTDTVRAELRQEGSAVRVSTVRLPSTNTPWFGWARVRTARHPRPLPPVYRPEEAARAVLLAADHAPRDVWVDGSTVLTRLADVLAPGLLDGYLIRAVTRASGDLVSPEGRQGNLDAPTDDIADYGAEGRFDWPTRRRSWLLDAQAGLRGTGTRLVGTSVGTVIAAAALRSGAGLVRVRQRARRMFRDLQWEWSRRRHGRRTVRSVGEVPAPRRGTHHARNNAGMG